jgi:hypothetical protein
MQIENLTPNPFPSGKGNQIIMSATGPPFILLPFPLGKGPGVRFFASFTTPTPHSDPPLQKGEGLGERFPYASAPRARQRSAALILKKALILKRMNGET